MGGYFSTRWNGTQTRQETDPLLSLDIRWLKKEGCLKPGAVCQPGWTSRGAPSGNIVTRMSADGHCLTLDYSTRAPGEDWQAVSDRVWIDSTPCNYGGARPWFRCPGCQTRRGVLFSVGGRFRCRACHTLAYSSTREDAHERSIRRCAALRMRLGGRSDQPVWTIPGKPEGMSWRRYRQLADRLLHEIERQSDLFTDELRRIANRY